MDRSPGHYICIPLKITSTCLLCTVVSLHSAIFKCIMYINCICPLFLIPVSLCQPLLSSNARPPSLMSHVCLFIISAPHRGGKWYLSFWVWLFSLNRIISTNYFCKWRNSILHYGIQTPLCIKKGNTLPTPTFPDEVKQCLHVSLSTASLEKQLIISRKQNTKLSQISPNQKAKQIRVTSMLPFVQG